MKCLLSISSSEKNSHLQTFLWTVLFLVIGTALLSFMLNSDYVRAARGRRVTEQRHMLKKLMENSPKPLVLFIGSSKLWSAVDHDILQQMDSRYTFFNLSMDSMSVDEFYHLFLDMPLCNVHTVFLESVPFNFNTHLRHPLFHKLVGNDFQQYVWLTWKERLFRPFSRRLLVIIDGLFGRDLLPNHYENIQNLTRPLPESWDAYYSPDPLLAQKKEDIGRTLPFFQVPSIGIDHLWEYQVDSAKKQLFLETVDRISSQNVNVGLLHLPVRHGYYDVIETQKRTEKYQEYLDMMHTAHCDYLLFWNAPDDTPFAAEDLFIDYGHYSQKGRKLFTKFLYETLVQRGVLPGQEADIGPQINTNKHQ